MAVILKRKRAIRTSIYQYETYLSYMEDCNVFRSGKIDPTLSPNFLENKWEELTKTLNKCDVGPILTSSEWQTRFNNWKNSTRQKYRNYVAEQKRTGGGPQNEKVLSTLEERGLDVWGRVAVTGTPKVSLVGGLYFGPQDSLDICESTEVIHMVAEGTDNFDDSASMGIDTVVPETIVIHTNSTPSENFIEDPNLEFEVSSVSNNTVSHHDMPHTYKKFKNSAVLKSKHKLCGGTTNKTVKNIGAELLNAYENDRKIKTRECEKQKELETKRIRLDKVRLQFEIAKYKFENPSFVFDENDLSQI